MQNSSILKNELIFQYAAGTASLSKSLMASTYLFLNSKESNIYKQFEEYCGEELKNTNQIQPDKLTAEECLIEPKITTELVKTKKLNQTNPINNFIDDFNFPFLDRAMASA